MATFTLPKISSLKDIDKWPLAFACVAFLWIVREFMADNRAKNKENTETYKQQALRLQKENDRKDTAIVYWQSKYIHELQKNLSDLKRKDSAYSDALLKPAKEILKTVKQHSNEKAP